MDPTVEPMLTGLTMVGLVAGLWLLWRGLGGYRTATRIGDTSTSAVATMAAGEVRIAGVVEPAEVALVSPLQSQPCVYYHATIAADGDMGGWAQAFDASADLDEERAVGFRVRDASGSVRIFPRGARWDAPVRLDERGAAGDTPVGVHWRRGSAIGALEGDRASAIATLLRVTPPSAPPIPSGRRDRRFRETRLEPGDPVTIIGRAMPFSDLVDPAEADVAIGGGLPADDPEVAADLAEARAAGLLADDPEEAWGNAAIPGFGIGQPIRAPELHPEADSPALAPAADAQRFAATFHIPPEELVLVSAPDVPLLIAHGTPGSATERHQDRFLVGLLGAMLAIGSAMALAVVLTGGARGFGP
jgi:hypothetical protein